MDNFPRDRVRYSGRAEFQILNFLIQDSTPDRMLPINKENQFYINPLSGQFIMNCEIQSNFVS